MESARCYGHCALVNSPRTPLPPPPTHLSTTNAAPLESELRTTRERIHAGRIRLSEIDDAINQLHQERQDVLHNIEQHLSILSPIRNLPSDVLAEIFSWTLLPEGYFPSTKIAASPWVLTHVCAAWRSLAISLPALWLSVRFDKRVSLAMLQTQLARSGQRPLTIYFSSSNVEAFKSILDHSNRWHTADLWIFDWMVPLLNAAAGSLPLLRSLTYHMKDLSLPPCKAFETAPRLCEVIAHSSSILSLPLAQLIRLRCGTLDLLPLRLAHNLIELTLTGSNFTVGGNLIELPRLKRLHVYDGSLLRHFVLPALEDIYIDHTILPLVSLVERSSCTLRKLRALTTELAIVNILEHIPTLLELHAVFTLDTISRLIISPHFDLNHRPICPELHTANFLLSGNSAEATITRLKESRHKNPLCAPLSLHLFDQYTWSDVCESLRRTYP